MVEKSLLIKRLTLIKYLYQQGVEQSKKPESIAGFAVLSFHDSIEMFLKLLVEHKNEKDDKSFMDHWNLFPNLTLKESIRRLNNVRVNFKHKGILPAKADIEAFKIYTNDFFVQNTLTQFNVKFDELSLLELVNYEIVKDFLKKANEYLISHKLKESISNSALAFNSLLLEIDKTKKSNYHESLLPIDEDGDLLSGITTFDMFYSGNATPELEIIGRNFSQFSKNIKKEIDFIKNQFKLISYGINYMNYSKFVLLTPSIHQNYYTREYEVLRFSYDVVEINQEHCQYCIDFVIECAIIMQDFDHNLNSLTLPIT